MKKLFVTSAELQWGTDFLRCAKVLLLHPMNCKISLQNELERLLRDKNEKALTLGL
jgi:hypothetical protein